MIEVSSVKYLVEIIKKIKLPRRFVSFEYIRNIIIVYLVIIVPLIGYSLYRISKEPKVSDEETEDTAKVIPMVKVMKVKKGNFNDTLSVNGTIKGTSEIELRFEISGKIASFNFREGDAISKGENIISLAPEDVMTRLRHAKSKLHSIKSRYGAAVEKLKVYRELYEMGAIIRAKLNEIELSVDSLKSEVDTAKAEVELAQSHLEKTVISSIEDGVMGTKKVEVGDFITPNDVVGTFLEVKSVYVEMGVIEKDIEKIAVGQKVKVKVDAYPEKIFWGKIDNISKQIVGETRTLPAKVIISNPSQKLISGMYADCDIYMAEFRDIIIIPAASVIKLGEMTVVPLVKTEDELTGIIELRKITIGYISSTYATVEDGLEANDLIVMETQMPLKDAMNVKIIEITEASLDE